MTKRTARRDMMIGQGDRGSEGSGENGGADEEEERSTFDSLCLEANLIKDREKRFSFQHQKE